jgi:hypothetical protein
LTHFSVKRGFSDSQGTRGLSAVIAVQSQLGEDELALELFDRGFE